MEKNTIIAVVLMALIFFGFSFLNSYLYPPTETKIEENITENNINVEGEVNTDETSPSEASIIAATEIVKEEEFSFETDLFKILFTNKGGSIKELRLKEHFEKNNPEELLKLNYSNLPDNRLFTTYLGDYTNEIINDNFEYIVKENSVEFFADVNYQNNTIRIVKTFNFLPNDYMFEVNIEMISDNVLPSNENKNIYGLKVADQIGPNFESLTRFDEIRKISIGQNGKRDEVKTKKGSLIIDEEYQWAAIEGKFFTVAIIPEYKGSTAFFNDELEGKFQKNQLVINRSFNNETRVLDTYKVYAGPKDDTILKQYNETEKNNWNLSNLGLEGVLDFWFLGVFFMWLLRLINSLVGNYGVSIILLTFAIKALLYPITRKSFDSMAKMQALQPKIEDIRKKYKDDPTKLNTATADLYKKEGVNPLGGCLPMLLQMPVFITFYSLLNEYIGLRGATFIPGWINDLSQPENILQFGFSIPLLGWDSLRVLPILYLASQLITMKITQKGQKTAATAGPGGLNQKMLTLGMPIMFFFIMYNQTSGLLLYWTTMNIIQGIQQVYGKKHTEKELMQKESDKQSKKRKENSVSPKFNLLKPGVF